MPSFTLPYRDFQGRVGHPAGWPYLALDVTGINGRSGRIVGLVDSGADRTSLPMGFSALMGYASADLESATVMVADGSSISVLNARTPAEAIVAGLPQPRFELYPTFVPGNVPTLWGRADFFQHFSIGFNEAGRTFTLTT